MLEANRSQSKVKPTWYGGCQIPLIECAIRHMADYARTWLDQSDCWLAEVRTAGLAISQGRHIFVATRPALVQCGPCKFGLPGHDFAPFLEGLGSMAILSDCAPDESWARLKSLPDRPEFVPRGYEFLPDAFARDARPHGREALEIFRQALAEGDIVALLQSHLGHRELIPQRIWNKYPFRRRFIPASLTARCA